MTDDRKIIDALRFSNHVEREYSADGLECGLSAWNLYKNRTNQKITNGWILSCHDNLMGGILPDKIVGKFRTCQVTVGGKLCNIHFEDVPKRIEEWCEKWGTVHLIPEIEYPSSKIKINLPSEREKFIAQAHIEFEKIHPFEDGNGRVGRFIMNLQLHRAGLDPIIIVPYSEAETRTERDRVTQSEYYKWFE